MKKANKFVLIFTYVLMKIRSQVIFHENFQQYDTGTNFLVYMPFNGSWYRSDVLKQSGMFKIKGPNTRISSKYLSVFAESNSSVNCVDINLLISSFYSLSFDYTWQTFNNSLLYVTWNSVTIFSTVFSGSQGSFLHKSIELPQTNLIVNTLCFSGSNPLSGIKVGPSIDNIQIQFVYSNNASSNSNSTFSNDSFNASISSKNNTLNNSNFNSNSSISNISNNSSISNETMILPDSQTIDNKNVNGFLSIEWVNEFVIGFNNFLTVTSFFGFSYLISNLLNFWNIIILYYFISNNSLLSVYKSQLLVLCKNSLQEGSIFSLLGKFAKDLNIFIPFWGFEKVNRSSTEWPSFLQLGFSSQILRNNAQVYINLVSLIFKLLLVRAVIKILKKLSCSIFKMSIPKNVMYLQIYSYEIANSLPTLVTPLAIMLSSQSSLSYSCLKQKVNNMLQVLSILVGVIGILIPSLITKKCAVKAPEKAQIKSTIFIESKKSIDFNEQRPKFVEVEKKTKKMIEEQYYLERLNQFNLMTKHHKVKSLKQKQQILNQLLFFTVPFLIGLQQIALFFTFIFLHIIILIAFLLFNRKLIKFHSRAQFWFTLAIRLIFLCIHLIFLLLHLQQLHCLGLSRSQLEVFSFLAIAGIISGALLQLLHTITNFFIWIAFKIKMIKRVYFASKIIDESTVNIKKKICRNNQDCSVKDKINQVNETESKNPSYNQSMPRNLELVAKTLKILQPGNQVQRVTKVIFDSDPKQFQYIS